MKYSTAAIVGLLLLVNAGCVLAPTQKSVKIVPDTIANARIISRDNDPMIAEPGITALLPAGYQIDNMVTAKNHEGKMNAVLLLADARDRTSERMVMILQQSQKNGWQIQDTNAHLAGPEYTPEGTKIFDDEELSMHGDTIQFLQHNAGPTGNREFLLVRENGHWFLNSMETFNVGAGSQRVMNYTVEKSRVVVTIFNTMQADLPEEKCPFTFRKNQSLSFRDLYPDSLLTAITKQQALSTANCKF